MTTHRVVVSFTAYVEATTTDEVNKQIETLLNELGEVNTTLSWDDCEWETYTYETIEEENN